MPTNRRPSHSRQIVRYQQNLQAVRYDNRMNRQRFLISAGIAAVVALGAWLWPIGGGNREAVITQPVAVPERVTWEGEVIGILESGGSLAVSRSDGSGAFAAVLAEPITEPLEGTVWITGTVGEDTCAYRNTVFSGECVPQLLNAVIDASVH
jgi:hypothetical protein